MKNKNNSTFPFISSDSIIKYDKVHHNIEEFTNIKDPKYKDKLYFIYDKQSDRFIYFYDSNIFIFNSKGTLEKYAKVDLIERIKIAAVEYNLNFLLLLTRSNQAIICDLKNNISENYNNSFDKGNFIGGFFIKRRPDKDNKYCKLCMVGEKKFIISKIYVEQNEKGEYIFKRKHFYTSKEMQIFNYFYNSDHNVVIIRLELCDFLLVNLKSKTCYETLITLDHLNMKDIILSSMFLVRNIYHQLYFIHMNSKNIEFYGLKDLKNKKPPKVIKLDLGVNPKNIKLQFTNNLIFVYNNNNIFIYDIKSKINNKILTIKMDKNKEYIDIYKNMRVYGDYITIGRDFYRTKFDSETYFDKKYKENENESFLIILRRDNSKNIIKNILIEILQNYEITKLFNLISILVKNNARNNKEMNYDKKNAYQVSFSGKNYFYLNSDEIFTLFSRKIKDRDPTKIIQLMGIIYNLYETNNIKVENDIFISTLFYHLNQIKDFSFYESLFKNGLVPLNHKLGLYLIDRAIHSENENIIEKKEKDKNEISDNDILFNLGIENLMEKEEDGMNEAINELFKEKKFFECFDLASYYLCKKNDNKLEYFGYIKNLIGEQFYQFNKKETNEPEEENKESNEEKN